MLKPSSQWVLDYGENRCRIVRTFADDDDGKTVIYFEQHSPRSGFAWLIAGDAVPKKSKVKIRFGPDNGTIEKSGNTMTLGSYGPAIGSSGFAAVPEEVVKVRSLADMPSRDAGDFGTSPPPELVSTEHRDFGWVEVAAETKDAVRLPLENMSEIQRAMRTCTDDLLRSWGLDPTQEAVLAQHPRWTNMSEVAKDIVEVYPRAAYMNGEQGTLALRIMVEADGTPSKCVRADLNETENLDNSACLLIMKKAQFEPAISADGEPVASYVMQMIRYTLPN